MHVPGVFPFPSNNHPFLINISCSYFPVENVNLSLAARTLSSLTRSAASASLSCLLSSPPQDLSRISPHKQKQFKLLSLFHPPNHQHTYSENTRAPFLWGCLVHHLVRLPCRRRERRRQVLLRLFRVIIIIFHHHQRQRKEWVCRGSQQERRQTNGNYNKRM